MLNRHCNVQHNRPLDEGSLVDCAKDLLRNVALGAPIPILKKVQSFLYPCRKMTCRSSTIYAWCCLRRTVVVLISNTMSEVSEWVQVIIGMKIDDLKRPYEHNL